MAIEEILPSFADLISSLPPNVIEKIGGLITVLKAVGVAVIVYIIYAVAMGILNFYKIKRIKHIEEKVDLIDKKINRLLKKKK